MEEVYIGTWYVVYWYVFVYHLSRIYIAYNTTIYSHLYNDTGDLFVLDPRDEKYMKRGGKSYKSRFKHGGIEVSSAKDMLSIGLIFRNVTAKQRFDLKSGKVKLDDSFWSSLSDEKLEEYKRRDDILSQFTSSGQLYASHLRLKHLFVQMKAKYF